MVGEVAVNMVKLVSEVVVNLVPNLGACLSSNLELQVHSKSFRHQLP